MKKHLKKGLLILISFVFLFLTCNTYIFAKDIEIKATKDNTIGDIVFISSIGAYPGTWEPWVNAGKRVTGEIEWEYEDASHQFVKPFGDSIRGGGWLNATIRSYSYVVHTAPFSKYTSGNNYGYKKGSIYGTNSKTNVSGLDKKDFEKIKYVEFTRYERRETIRQVEQGIKYASLNENQISKNYIKEIKNKLGTSNVEGEKYYKYYISEPIGYRYFDFYPVLYNSNNRSVYDKNGSNEIKEVGFLTAAENTQLVPEDVQPEYKESWAKKFGLDGLRWT